jgi:hypothetical protein
VRLVAKQRPCAWLTPLKATRVAARTTGFWSPAVTACVRHARACVRPRRRRRPETNRQRGGARLGTAKGTAWGTARAAVGLTAVLSESGAADGGGWRPNGRRAPAPSEPARQAPTRLVPHHDADHRARPIPQGLRVPVSARRDERDHLERVPRAAADEERSLASALGERRGCCLARGDWSHNRPPAWLANCYRESASRARRVRSP